MLHLSAKKNPKKTIYQATLASAYFLMSLHIFCLLLLLPQSTLHSASPSIHFHLAEETYILYNIHGRHHSLQANTLIKDLHPMGIGNRLSLKCCKVLDSEKKPTQILQSVKRDEYKIYFFTLLFLLMPAQSTVRKVGIFSQFMHPPDLKGVQTFGMACFGCKWAAVQFWAVCCKAPLFSRQLTTPKL